MKWCRRWTTVWSSHLKNPSVKEAVTRKRKRKTKRKTSMLKLPGPSDSCSVRLMVVSSRRVSQLMWQSTTTQPLKRISRLRVGSYNNSLRLSWQMDTALWISTVAAIDFLWLQAAALYLKSASAKQMSYSKSIFATWKVFQSKMMKQCYLSLCLETWTSLHSALQAVCFWLTSRRRSSTATALRSVM